MTSCEKQEGNWTSSLTLPLLQLGRGRKGRMPLETRSRHLTAGLAWGSRGSYYRDRRKWGTPLRCHLWGHSLEVDSWLWEQKHEESGQGVYTSVSAYCVPTMGTGWWVDGVGLEVGRGNDIFGVAWPSCDVPERCLWASMWAEVTGKARREDLVITSQNGKLVL